MGTAHRLRAEGREERTGFLRTWRFGNAVGNAHPTGTLRFGNSVGEARPREVVVSLGPPYDSGTLA